MDDKQNAYIKRFIAKNFRKFAQCEVEFSPGLNIFVGPNNAGKTTILEGLDILIGEKSLSPLAIKRSFFKTFEPGKLNRAQLVAEINYPGCGIKDQEVNLVKQLKRGKGSANSKLPNSEFNKHISGEDILTDKVPLKGAFSQDIRKSGYEVLNILLVTEIIVNENFTPEVTNDLYINFEENGYKGCYKIMGISGSQKSSLFNYLFLPANRIDNKPLSEVTDFNWLGRYIKGYVKKNGLNPELQKFSDNSNYPTQILDPGALTVFSGLFSKKESLGLNLFNKADPDSIITNGRFYIEDGFTDELINKGHGIQSAAIISLFAGYGKFQSEDMPKNEFVHGMWNTVFSLEEPESHFQFPLRNKLLRVLKEEFLENGSQVFLSTHDEGFIKWQYINQGRIIFPHSLKENRIKTLNLPAIQDPNEKRIIRFNSNCFFTDVVLIVEGQEEICIDLLFQMATSRSVEELGILVTRSVGQIRKKAEETADENPFGGKDDIPANIRFFKDLNIETICLLDIDVLFGRGETIKKIYKEKTGQELELSGTYTIDEPKGYLKLRKWWISNKSDPNLAQDLQKLGEAGIFLFPGDFEALFKDDYLKIYEREDDPNQLNKEKFTYETKYNIETDYDNFKNYLAEETEEFLRGVLKSIESYVEVNRMDGGTEMESGQGDNNKAEDIDDFPF